MADWEHPRVRGEDTVPWVLNNLGVGTPSRARGRREFHWVGTTEIGNTPACAGKTMSPMQSGVDNREHPRVRGEDRCSIDLNAVPAGTPPRARGRRTRHAPHEPPPGNTPACAGKTIPMAPPEQCDREHPRVRGEDVRFILHAVTSLGTPPRARGRHVVITERPTRIGNTPACAGKTKGPPKRHTGDREHPRVRGEDEAGNVSFTDLTGTPPRARGRQNSRLTMEGKLGNTPACAGKTTDSPAEYPQHREHPRVRGEDGRQCQRALHPAGTPPRARGRRMAPASTTSGEGNTPACAGKTNLKGSIRMTSRTPPRARGRHRQVRHRYGRHGNTPACAGKT